MARRSTNEAVQITSMTNLSETAARIAAMLDRWEAEDVSDEPDWDIADLEPVELRGNQPSTKGTGSST